MIMAPSTSGTTCEVPRPRGTVGSASPDAVFESPVVYTPQRGRDVTFKYLLSADKVLGGPGFAYVGEWRGDTGAILEFENDGIMVNGVDMITFGDDGCITHFKVMVRPPRRSTC